MFTYTIQALCGFHCRPVRAGFLANGLHRCSSLGPVSVPDCSLYGSAEGSYLLTKPLQNGLGFIRSLTQFPPFHQRYSTSRRKTGAYWHRFWSLEVDKQRWQHHHGHIDWRNTGSYTIGPR